MQKSYHSLTLISGFAVDYFSTSCVYSRISLVSSRICRQLNRDTCTLKSVLRNFPLKRQRTPSLLFILFKQSTSCTKPLEAMKGTKQEPRGYTQKYKAKEKIDCILHLHKRSNSNCSQTDYLHVFRHDQPSRNILKEPALTPKGDLS